MEPTSRGFAEVRDAFSRELVELSKNTLNGGGKDLLGEQMERLSMLAFHPVKMQSCYEKVEQLNLEGLQQRFDVSSPAVFVQRAQILMREQMDNAVYTFEQLLNQSLEGQGSDEDLCKTIQRCEDRVLKKYDYDSSTVRKKFFREALLQMIIPYMLRHLSPSCSPVSLTALLPPLLRFFFSFDFKPLTLFDLICELPKFKELIFEDFSRFLLVENVFEEVVLQSVSKDIMMAVKEAAVQRRHNLYRDSMVLTNSDPNLHLLGESPSVDWAAKFSSDPEGEGEDGGGGGGEGTTRGGGGAASAKRRRQVVSMIQLEGLPLAYESCMEVPGVDQIPEDENEDGGGGGGGPPRTPKSPDSVHEIRGLINPMVELGFSEAGAEEGAAAAGDCAEGTAPASGTIVMEDGVVEDVKQVTTLVEGGGGGEQRKVSPQDMMKRLIGSSRKQEAAAAREIETAGGEDAGSDGESSKTNEGSDEAAAARPVANGLRGADENEGKVEDCGEKVAVHISDVACEI
ncbi:Niban-like protein 1 [Merluccius polli]|uniref:Niban-like protein 1 n=1 Tax=Merluccius polli TaxID=89951 RepID=A0AA47MYH9_MERPO|nr:Niban-like protein 1 [Merluccius polli]